MLVNERQNLVICIIQINKHVISKLRTGLIIFVNVYQFIYIFLHRVVTVYFHDRVWKNELEMPTRHFPCILLTRDVIKF